MDRRSFIQGAGALMLGAALPRGTFAANPTAPGRLVFGIPSGAVGSRLAEVALQLLAREYKLDYRLDVRDQRNTQEATELVKAAAPDGATLLQAQSGTMVLLPNIYRSVNYNPVTDFTPLALLGEFTYTLTVGPAVPASVKDIEGYVAWVNQNPEYRDLGFSVYGSQVHLISLMLARGRQIALRPLPYKSPRSLAADVENGTLAAAIMLGGSAAAVGSKNLRNLAISSSQRVPMLPDLPTFKEQGLPEITLTGWYAWYAPARTPSALTQSLHDKLMAIQTLPEFVAMQKKIMVTPLNLSPDQITARIRQETVSYRDLVTRYGLSQMV